MERSERSVGPFVAHTEAYSFRIWYRPSLAELNDSRSIVARTYASENADFIEERKFNFLRNYDNVGLVQFGAEHPLKEDSAYVYRVGYLDSEGRFSAFFKGSVRTFSRKKDKPISFICGSCRHLYVKHAEGGISSLVEPNSSTRYGDRAFKSMYEHPEGLPDFMIMTGDQVYCDHEEGSFVSLKPARNLDEYYDNYYRAYQQEYFAKIGSKIPFFMAMDDHEIKNDWRMDMIMDTHSESDDNRTHYMNGMKAYLVYQASLTSVIRGTEDFEGNLDKLSDVRYETTITESDIPYNESTKGLFYTYSHGPARFFSLDVRAERYMAQFSPQMVGEMQIQALKNWLVEYRSDEYVKFIISAVPMFPDTRNVLFFPFGAPEDKWGAFCEQRLEILEFIRLNDIRKVVFISGDVHVSLFSKLLYNNKDTGVYSIISSGFSWPVPGLQRFNFDWKALPNESKYRGDKRVPDKSKRGSYKPVKLSDWRFIKTGHREHNYCRVETNGRNLRVSYYTARDGEKFEEIEVDLHAPPS